MKQRIICTLCVTANSSATVDTLLIAWNIIGQTDAVSARVTAIDSDGVTVRAECRNSYTGKQYTETGKFEFTSPAENKTAVQSELDKMASRSRVVSWPPGPGALLSAALLIGCLSCTAEINPAVTSIYLQKIQAVSMIALGSIHNARIAVCLILVSHTLEALYVATICNRLKFTKFQTATWLSMVVLLGYPCTSRAKYLDTVAQRTDAGIKCKNQ